MFWEPFWRSSWKVGNFPYQLWKKFSSVTQPQPLKRLAGILYTSILSLLLLCMVWNSVYFFVYLDSYPQWSTIMWVDDSTSITKYKDWLEGAAMYIPTQVKLLWQRAIGDPEFRRIFCLVHAERLTYQVSDKALRSLSDLSQGQRGEFAYCDVLVITSMNTVI